MRFAFPGNTAIRSRLDLLLEGLGRDNPRSSRVRWAGPDRFARMLCGSAPDAGRGAAVRVLCFSLLSVLIALAFGSMLPAMAPPCSIIFEAVRSHLREQRRVLDFESEYAVFLQSLASSIRTGLDPVSALMRAENLFPRGSVLRSELSEFGRSIESGMSESECILSFARGIEHPDLPAFRTAFLLSRTHGASLGQCLQRLGRVTRQRQSFRRKVRAAVAMQRLSGIGIALCTVILCGMQAASNPAAFRNAWEHPIGSRVLALGFALIVGGLLWMAYLVRGRR